MVASREVEVLRAIAGVGDRFKQISRSLQATPGMSKVARSCLMEEFDVYPLGEGSQSIPRGGFVIEWFVEADYHDGRTITFAQTLTLRLDQWTVTARVMAQDRDDQNEVLVIPDRAFADSCELTQNVTDQAIDLVRDQDLAIDLFVRGVYSD